VERLLKILIVHEVNYLSKIIYEFQILPELLSILGHDITIIDYDDSWRANPDKPLIAKRTVFSRVQRAYPQAAVRLIRPAMIRLPLISRISGAFTCALEVRRFIQNEKPDVIVLYGIPTVGMQVLSVAKRFRVPVVFRSIDVSHQLVPSRLLIRPTRILEKYVYRRAQFSIALTSHLREYIISYGVPAESVRLLPSGVDSELFSPGMPETTMMDELHLEPGDHVILFMGTMYRFSGLDRIICDFPLLLVRHPKAKLLIVGTGEDEARLRRLTVERDLQDAVIFAGFRPYTRLPDIVRCSEICINPFELNETTAKILPTKLFQYLACGKPVVATELPGTLPFLSGEEHGVVYASLDQFVDRLSELLSDALRRRTLGERGVAVARQYEWKRIAETMVGWLQELA
jgi:glycosyltransferase involved in cell wall biosynthesis